MDHLRLPLHPVSPPLKIAFLEHEYQGGPFLGYPERHGVSDPAIYQTSRTESLEDVAAILQSWLFFGLLEEVLECKIPTADFTYNDGRRYFQTHQLPYRVQAWLAYTCTTSPEEKKVRHEICRKCCEVAELTLQKISAYNKPLLLQLSKEGHTSLGALLNYLTVAIGIAFDGGKVRYPGNVALEDCLTDQMKEHGWCPNQIEHLRRGLDIEGFYYVSNLTRTEQRIHDHCTSERCSKLDPYKQQHSEEFCNSSCKDIRADQKKMLQILKDGYIPLIRFDDNASFELLSSQHVAYYIAISHVWSDGLGNHVANSLPECQLSYMSQAVKALSRSTEPIPFWMDTICCPLKPLEAYELAMAKMYATYRDAEQVLVLDKSLQSIDALLLGREEPLVRIACSAWIRRLWTLQEANLAKNLQFKFSDCILDIHDILRQVLPPNTRSVSCRSLRLLASNPDYELPDDELRTAANRDRPVTSSESFPDVPSEKLHKAVMLSLELSPHKGINRILWTLWVWLRPRQLLGNQTDLNMTISALRYRSTSVSTDEPLCLGALLNLDIKEILSVPPNKRMIQIWILLGQKGGLTKGLFFAEGPKLDFQRYRWAPATVLGLSNGDIISRSLQGQATLVEEGLLFESPGFLITWKKPLLNKFYFRDLHSNWYKVFLAEKTCWRAEQSPGSPICYDRSQYPRLLGLVIQVSHEMTMLSGPQVPTEAVLVAIEKQENDVIYMSIICRANMERIIGREVYYREVLEQCFDRGSEHIQPILWADLDPTGHGGIENEMNTVCGVSGRLLPASQQWCCN